MIRFKDDILPDGLFLDSVRHRLMRHGPPLSVVELKKKIHLFSVQSNLYNTFKES